MTNDGEDSRDRLHLEGLTGPGIISNYYLAAFQSEISNSIDRPTTLIEFTPSGEPIRTDSPLLRYNFHPACLLFRKFNSCDLSLGALNDGCGPCIDSDAHHARLFYGQTRAQIDEHLPSAVNDTQDPFFKIYESKPTCSFERLTIDNRTFLTYDCPWLGMRECLFPIYVEDRVVGVLFDGQIVLREKVDFIQGRIHSLVETIPDYFKQHPDQQHSETSPQTRVNEILAAHDQWMKENQKRVMTEDVYKAHLKKICQEITRLEDRLEEELTHQRRQYINEHVGVHIEQFRNKLPQKQVSGREALDTLWRDVEDVLSGLATDFSFRYMAVFSIPNPTTEPASRLQIVARTDDLPEPFADPGDKNAYLDIGALPDGKNHGFIYTSTDHYAELQKSLGGVALDALGNFFLVSVGVPLHPLSSIAILVGCTDTNPCSAKENWPHEDLDRTLQSFYTLVVSSLSAILAATSEQDIDKRLRILRHEVGQLTTGIDALRVIYMNNPEAVRGLTDKKASDLSRDLDAFRRLIYLIFESVKYSIDELPKISPDHFLAFRELLFKWKDIYRLEAKMKCLEFYLPEIVKDDPERPHVYGDQYLIEQLVYNLVNNAVKYCHRGTRIHLDCAIDQGDRSMPHLLTVTNYGVHMPMEEYVYELFQRGTDAPDDGLGVGLWLAKKIALAHGGSIRHTSTLVSRFNLPLMEPYLRQFTSYTDPVIRDQVQEELDRLRSSGECDAVLTSGSSDNRYNPFVYEVLNNISQPTYRVRIHVTIPRAPKRGTTK